MFDCFVEALDEFAFGSDAINFLHCFESNDLGYDGNIFTGEDWEMDEGDFDIEVFDEFFVNAEAVIRFDVAVVFKADFNFDAFLSADGADTKGIEDVYDADSADFEDVLEDFLAGADKDFGMFLVDADNVICNEAVSALDEVEGDFTFSDTAPAGEKDADAIDVY